MISPVPSQSLQGTWTCKSEVTQESSQPNPSHVTDKKKETGYRGTNLLHHRTELSKHDLGSLSVTARALLDRALLAALSVTALADDVLLERELRDLALVEVSEGDVDPVNEVLALSRSLGSTSSSSAEPEGLQSSAREGDSQSRRCTLDSRGEAKRNSRLLLLHRRAGRTGPERPCLLPYLLHPGDQPHRPGRKSVASGGPKAPRSCVVCVVRERKRV